MAKELGLGQQLVAKHLEILEKAGVVTSNWKTSPQGPRRKNYLLSRSISITLDFAPHLFSTRMNSFTRLPESRELTVEASSQLKRLRKIREYSNVRSRLRALAKLLEDIDVRIRSLEEGRAHLLHVRNLGMQEVSDAITALYVEQEGRRILHRIVDEHDRNIESISRALNMRESLVHQILSDFENL